MDIKTVTGPGLDPWLGRVASLRTTVFREYPYLYDGNAAYERDYLQTYRDCPEAIVLLVVDEDGDDETVVGASTGLPLVAADPAFRQPFEAAGIDPAAVFYFGESVLLPEYRGRGIGHGFFDLREDHAAKLGLPITTFCAVDRPADHPKRPTDYRSLDPFWTGRGYVKRPDLQAVFDWKDLGQAEETPHTLTFWLRGGFSS
ncbi:GNAT family N-acetyltransferase [Wenzhouxiangella sp. XN79A]|uniref:GNAT family N-acetyltransferase n=1 Tax=Wenzhouxiangella sp. XN79A TaxID=2724193 RepID=UPI00144A8D42|nr:GNAT family N-acetyltransferase [Wenzhouxiangella sp. XN79A]NKI34645.1 GNAT family N-acetyltransferase [Wenzhouxiangella sp. XN79A]